MLLEKKRDAEIRQRKGTTVRTIFMVIGLGLWGVIGYFLMNYLFENDILSYGDFYSLGIPNEVPEWAILGVFVFFIMIFMQWLVVLGFFIASPSGRERRGKPSITSLNRHLSNEDTYLD